MKDAVENHSFLLHLFSNRENFSEVSNFTVGLPDGVQRYAEW